MLIELGVVEQRHQAVLQVLRGLCAWGRATSRKVVGFFDQYLPGRD